ncbi:MAG: hypothetical protein RR101_04400 [Burkholderiaceae bacterium]
MAPEKPTETPDATERQWKLIALKAEVARTVAISIIGTAIAAIFYVYQDNQTQSRYYSDLQSQRERADTDLRAQMFNTLFQNYFKARLEATQRARDSKAGAQELTAAQLNDLRQEIVLSDLLARNFDAVDVRPMFEDVDRRLSERIDAGREGQEAITDQRQAFALREQLRRVARGATTRQTASLIARAGARSQQLVIEQCDSSDGTPPAIKPDLLPTLPHGVNGIVERVADGTVNISLAHSLAVQATAATPAVTTTPQRVPVSVTHYDMPALENTRLPNGERIALTLTRFLSAQGCERFWTEIDETTRNDCSPLLADANNRGRFCNRAEITLTLIPADYIGVRDRPYLNELSATKSGSRTRELPRPGGAPN